MAKKKFISPFVLYLSYGEEGSETGKYSQQASVPEEDEEPTNGMDYGEWTAVVAQDLDDNGIADSVDYSQWMEVRGFADQINPKMNPDG